MLLAMLYPRNSMVTIEVVLSSGASTNSIILLVSVLNDGLGDADKQQKYGPRNPYLD